MDEDNLIGKKDIIFCLSMAKTMSEFCKEDEKVNPVKLHLLLALLNHFIGYATNASATQEVTKEFLKQGIK